MHTLQALAVFQVGWNYLLPTVILVVCYSRILVVVRHRQAKVNHITVSPGRSQNDNALNVSQPEKQIFTKHGETSSGPSRTASVSASAATGATTKVSHRQMNILQTMILITMSFTILAMPFQLSVLLIYFQVSLNSSCS